MKKLIIENKKVFLISVISFILLFLFFVGYLVYKQYKTYNKEQEYKLIISYSNQIKNYKTTNIIDTSNINNIELTPFEKYIINRYNGIINNKNDKKFQYFNDLKQMNNEIERLNSIFSLFEQKFKKITNLNDQRIKKLKAQLHPDKHNRSEELVKIFNELFSILQFKDKLINNSNNAPLSSFESFDEYLTAKLVYLIPYFIYVPLILSYVFSILFILIYFNNYELTWKINIICILSCILFYLILFPIFIFIYCKLEEKAFPNGNVYYNHDLKKQNLIYFYLSLFRNKDYKNKINYFEKPKI